MKANIAVVKVKNNRIAKYQDFDVKAEADSHVVTYGGFTVLKPNSGIMPYWVVDSVAQTLTYDSSEELAWANEKPMRDWKSSMQETDAGMPRIWEDFLTLNGTDGWPQVTIDRHNSKVALRATKPEAS